MAKYGMEMGTTRKSKARKTTKIMEIRYEKSHDIQSIRRWRLERYGAVESEKREVATAEETSQIYNTHIKNS